MTEETLKKLLPLDAYAAYKASGDKITMRHGSYYINNKPFGSRTELRKHYEVLARFKAYTNAKAFSIDGENEIEIR